MRKINLLICCLVLLTACSKNDNNELTIPDVEEAPITNPTLKNASFQPSMETNTMINGNIDAENKTIHFTTLQWIDDVSAVNLVITTINGVNEEIDINMLESVDQDVLTEEIVLNLETGSQECIIHSPEGGVDKYIVKLESPQTTGLPVLKIDADDGYNIFKNPKSKDYAPSTINLINLSNTDFNLTDVRGGIRGRGNSTWQLAKKPLRIKFDEKTSMMGLPKEKSWVLLANHLDPTFLMNTVAFELAKRMNLEFTNTDFHVELYHNNEYMGNYQLTEQVQVKKDRVNVDKKTGYLVELDVYFDDDNKFKTPKLELPIMIKHPEKGPFTGIETDFSSLEDIMLADDFVNLDITKYLDVVSFAKYMLVIEITRNGEITHPKSVKLYKKDKQSMLMAGPVWDFDWAFGYTGKSFDYFNSIEKLLFTPFNSKPTKGTFFRHLLNNNDFREVYKETWNEFYKNGDYDLSMFLDQKRELLKKSVALNQMRWKHDYDYSDKIDQMKDWLTKRIEILNTEINKF